MPANGGEIKAYLTLDTSKFDSAMSKATGQASKFSSNVSNVMKPVSSKFDEVGKAAENASNKTVSKWETVGSKMSDIGGKLSLFVTAPLVGLGTAAFKVAGDFDQSMAAVKAISGATGEEFEALKQKALDLGSSTQYSAKDVADAMTTMAKAGWDSSQILDGMAGILDAAAASQEDLGTVSEITANAITGFKLEAADAAHVADVMVQVANAGTVDIKDLGESYKYVSPICSAMGVSIEDASAALLAMSKAGIKGSQAGTALRTMLLNLNSPTAEAQEWMNRLGIEVTNADGSFKSLNEIAKIMQGSFKGLTESEKAQAAEAIAGKHGVSGLLAVVDTAPEKYDEFTQSIENCNGVASQTASVMQDNVMFNLKQLRAALEALAVKVVGTLMPHIRKFIATLTDLANKFASLSPGTQSAILALLGVVAALGPVLKTVGTTITVVSKLHSAFGIIGPVIKTFAGNFGAMASLIGEGGGIIETVSLAFPKLGAVLSALAGPIGIVVAVIGALVAAFVYLWNTNEDFRNKIMEIWNGIVSSFQNFTQGIVDRLNALGFNFESIVDVIAAVWDGFCSLLAPVFEGAFGAIATILDTVFSVITGILDVFIGLFTLNWDQLWQGVQEIFGGIWNGIVGLFTGFFETLSNVSNVFFGWFGTSWQELWTNVGTFLTEVWNGIVTFFQDTWNNITTGIQDAWNAILEFFTNLWTNITLGIQMFVENAVVFFQNLPYNIGLVIGTIIGNVANFVVTMVTKAIELGTNFVNNIVTFFSQLPGNVANIISNVFSHVSSWAVNMWNKATEMARNFLNNVVTFFSQLPGRIAGFITDIWNRVTSWASDMWNKASEMGRNFLNNVVNFLSQLPGRVAEFLSNAIQSVIQWVADMGAKGGEAAQSLIDGVVNGAAGLASSVAEIGSNIVQGVWNGIQNAVGWFTSSVNSFFSGIVDGAKAALGISSPSRVFANEVGKWIPAGVAMGVESESKRSHGLIQTAFDNMLEVQTDMPEISTNSVDVFCDNVKDTLADLKTYVISVVSSIGEAMDSLSPQFASLAFAGNVSSYYSLQGDTGTSRRSVEYDEGRANASASAGDTFIFNSPKPIDEIEASKQMKRAKRELAEGF